MVGEIDSVSQLPSNISCIFRTTNSNWDGALPSKYTPYARFRSSHFGAYSFWLGVDADQAMWFARPVPEDGIPTLNDWRKVAVATPPQEFSLPLASGFSNGGGGNSVYWKDQFNQVHFLVSVTNQNSLSSGDVIATLPAGFRPSKTAIFVLGSLLSAVRKTGSLNVKSDGSIVYFGDPLSSGAVSFGAGAFVAAD